MKFSYYTIIGKDLGLLRGHVRNIKEHAGFDRLPCEKEFIVVVYTNPSIPRAVTDNILEYCASENIRTKLYQEPTDHFLTNLYECWNLGYELVDEGWVFRGGSDQVFSKDSFLAMYEAAESLREQGHNKFILQANTIENSVRLKEIGAWSRHFSLDLGSTFETFDYGEFQSFCDQANESVEEKILSIDSCLRHWGKPTALRTSLGNINRTDGCSWLMTKADFDKHGPMPPLENGVTGDVLIHDRMQLDGYQNYLVRDCITYHFVRGESVDTQTT